MPPPEKTIARRVGLILLVVTFVAKSAAAQLAVLDGFEDALPSWRDAGGDPQYRIEVRERTNQSPHSGQACEHLELLAGTGTHVYVAYDVAQTPIIDEFVPSLWVRADRPGTQLLVRAVLPSSRDPATGQPLVAVLTGTSYRQTGRWEQLRLDEAPLLLERAARQVRYQTGLPVDTRQAYVDQVLLNIYSGPGRTNVWIDDLEIGGVSDPLRRATHPSARPSVVFTQSSQNASPGGKPRVEFRGKVLLVDGHPFFPRMIHYNGESLESLKRLGLNAVLLAEPATPGILQEAMQTGMWLVAPPPAWTTIDRSAQPDDAMQIGPEYDMVLAWFLGEGLTEAQLEGARHWAKAIRRADRSARRPLVCGADSGLEAHSRNVDAILLSRLPVGSNVELSAYAQWIQQRTRLVAPGRPVWVTIQSRSHRRLLEQQALLSGVETQQAGLSSEQIRLLVYQALASEARGVCYQSDSPLGDASPAERVRTWAIELLNLELELVESWAAAGNLTAAISADKWEIHASLIGTDRAHLLLPIWCGDGAQYVADQSSGNDVSLKVPGIPSSHDVYQLTPASLRPLRHHRVTGGMRIVLDELGLTATVLLTGDPLVVNSLRGRSARVAARSARLQRDLAAAKLETVRHVHGQLAAIARPPEQAAQWLAAAAADLEQCDLRLAQGDYRTAYAQAQRAMRPLRLLERAHWDQHAAALGSAAASPLAATFQTLPAHGRMVRQLSSQPTGPNLVPAGDLDNLETMLGAGWRHVAFPSDLIRTTAQLSPRAAHSGSSGLRMVVSANDPQQPAPPVETTPLWIRSAPVRVEAGQWILIQCWVRIPRAITGSVDGLWIVDSLGGEELAQSIGVNRDWQPFKIYRAAGESGELTVSFGLSGLGEAWVDEVQINAIGSTHATPSLQARQTRRQLSPLPPVR